MADPSSISTCRVRRPTRFCQLPIRKRRPLLWFAAIQGVERNQDLARLAPKGCFIAAEAVEREVGQVGKTQKTSREFNGRADSRSDKIRLRPRHRFFYVRSVGRCRIAIVTDRLSPPEHCIDNFSRGREMLAGLPECVQMVGLNFEQAGLYGRG